MGQITITISDQLNGGVSVKADGLPEDLAERLVQNRATGGERIAYCLLEFADTLFAEHQEAGAIDGGAPKIITE